MQFKCTDVKNISEWLPFAASAGASVFHHPAWFQLLTNQYGFKIFIASVSVGGELKAGIPVCETGAAGNPSWLALPFTDFVHPLATDNECLTLLTDGLLSEAQARKAKHLELRWPFAGNFLRKDEAVLHQISLRELPADPLKAFSDMHRRGVKKAQKSGLVLRSGSSPELMEEYFRLHAITRKRQGVPVQPKSFFKGLLSTVLQENGNIKIVYLGENPVAGAVFLHFGDYYIYKYGASDLSYSSFRPNNLIFSTAITEARDMGYAHFNFGKTDFENEGLRQFKSGWGAIETPLQYSYYPEIPKPGMLKVVKEKIVAPVIRFSPDIVARVIGEIAYKYFPSI